MALVECDKEMCSKNDCTYTRKYTCCFDCNSMNKCLKEGDVCDYIKCGTSPNQCIYRVKE